MHPMTFAISYAPANGAPFTGQTCKNWACAVLSISPLDSTQINGIFVDGELQLFDKSVPAMQYALQNWKVALAMRQATEASEVVTVWEICDMEWWVGSGTPASILAAYMAETGTTHEDSTGSESVYPVRLSDDALDTLMFTDTDDDGCPTGTKRTFREQLAAEVAQGGPFPRMFACSEC